MRPVVKLLACSIVLVLTGCAHAPATRISEVPSAAPSNFAHPADLAVDGATVVRAIRLCRTQFAELQQQLGQPTRDGLLHKQHIVSWTLHWDAPTRELAVMLNAENTVVDIDWNVSPLVPWSPTDQCLAP